jgi:hypothetical protein
MMRWILLAGVGAAVFAFVRRGATDIDGIIEQGYAEGLRDPDFLTAYVAVRLYPAETWPPALDDTTERIRRWTEIDLAVQRWLATSRRAARAP